MAVYEQNKGGGGGSGSDTRTNGVSVLPVEKKEKPSGVAEKLTERTDTTSGAIVDALADAPAIQGTPLPLDNKPKEKEKAEKRGGGGTGKEIETAKKKDDPPIVEVEPLDKKKENTEKEPPKPVLPDIPAEPTQEEQAAAAEMDKKTQDVLASRGVNPDGSPINKQEIQQEPLAVQQQEEIITPKETIPPIAENEPAQQPNGIRRFFTKVGNAIKKPFIWLANLFKKKD